MNRATRPRVYLLVARYSNRHTGHTTSVLVSLSSLETLSLSNLGMRPPLSTHAAKTGSSPFHSPIRTTNIPYPYTFADTSRLSKHIA